MASGAVKSIEKASDKLPKVSVIIPCRNEGNFIGKCLDSVLSGDYPKRRVEVLVVDGMSEDSTTEIVMAYERLHSFVRFLDNPGRITPCALNLGLKNSKGDLILWLSAHNEYEKKHISKCVGYLYQFGADAVGGAIRPVPRNGDFIGKAVCQALSHPFGVGSSIHKTGSKKPIWADTAFGTCYKREVSERIGMFNENLVRGQDMEFSLRMKKVGLRTLLDTNILIYTMKNRPQQVKRRFQQHHGQMGISAVTLGELVFGAEHSQEVERNLADIEAMAARLEVVPFENKAAYHFGQIGAELYRTGQPIGPYDMMIAGQARAIGLILVTNNVKEFERVQGLLLEDWSEA